MMPRASLLKIRARELLADGQWHPIRPVEAELMRLVLQANPSTAIRAAEHERGRQQQRRSGGAPVRPRQRNIDPTELARIGAAVIMRELLRNGVDFEIKTTADGRQIRLGPRSHTVMQRAQRRRDRAAGGRRGFVDPGFPSPQPGSTPVMPVPHRQR